MWISTATARRRQHVAFLKYFLVISSSILMYFGQQSNYRQRLQLVKFILNYRTVSFVVYVNIIYWGAATPLPPADDFNDHSKLTFCLVSSSMSISSAVERQHHSLTTIAKCHRHTKLTFCSESSSMLISFTYWGAATTPTSRRRLQCVIVILN
jgi:hypothetical protein